MAKNGYLSLTRRVNEKIRVGDDIEILVARIEPGQVHIAIRAPREVPIWRDELGPARAGESKEKR